MNNYDPLADLRTSSRALADVTDRCVAGLDALPPHQALQSVLSMAELNFRIGLVGFAALKQFASEGADGADLFFARHSADGMRQIADAIHRTCDRIEKEAKPKDPAA